MSGALSATRCYICGHANHQSLEEHHLVPRRLNGSDSDENTVFLCGSCHNAIESLYDDSFYQRLGITAEGVDEDAFVKRSLGTEINPIESIDREVPKLSPHANFESWEMKLSIRSARDPTKLETEYDRKIESRVEDVIHEHREDILDRYDRELERSQSPKDIYDEVPEWWGGGTNPVNFIYRHGNAAVPVFHVVNTHENGTDYEKKMEGGEDIELYPINREKTKIPRGREDGMRSWLHVLSYRMHCSYCHTVFTEGEHSDMARHLRINHGIENPWTETDDTFGDKEQKKLHASGTGLVWGGDDE